MWMMTRYRSIDLPNGSYSLDDLWSWKTKMAEKESNSIVMSKNDDHNNQPNNDNNCMMFGNILVKDMENDSHFH